MGTDPFLWIALQSNSLCDRTDTNAELKTQFQSMVKYLKKRHKFYIPQLGYNMRNSREVGEFSKTLKSDFGSHEITSVIDKLATYTSSSTSKKPNVIPISLQYLNENFDSLIKTATECGKSNVILFGTSKVFDPVKIRDSLIKEFGMDETDIFYHSYESSKTKDDLKKFLLNPDGILICKDDLFTGMEAESVVYCMSDYDSDMNLRVNVMRACSTLNIIYSYEKNDEYYIDFQGANLNPTFIKECDEEMYLVVWKCLTCTSMTERGNTIHVCRSCCIGCHFGHQVEVKSPHTDFGIESVMCECKTNPSNCIFSNINSGS